MLYHLRVCLRQNKLVDGSKLFCCLQQLKLHYMLEQKTSAKPNILKHIINSSALLRAEKSWTKLQSEVIDGFLQRCSCCHFHSGKSSIYRPIRAQDKGLWHLTPTPTFQRPRSACDDMIQHTRTYTPSLLH